MSRSIRPTPPDLAEMAQRLLRKPLERHYGCGQRTMDRWLADAGVTMPDNRSAHAQRPRECPKDFRLHGHKPNAVLMEIYGSGHDLIARWRKECGIKSPTNVPKRPPMMPVPDDFRTVAPRLTRAETAAHYGVGASTVLRWAKETHTAARPPINPHREISMSPSGRTVRLETFRSCTLADRAADHLRSPRAGGWHVHRCWSTGVADPKGDWWRVGTKPPMSAADLVAMARRKGFDADEWRMVA